MTPGGTIQIQAWGFDLICGFLASVMIRIILTFDAWVEAFEDGMNDPPSMHQNRRQLTGTDEGTWSLD